MCCFSGPVEDVSNTKIFARFMKPGVQAIVYQMEYKAKEPLAMILPIPVASKKEDAVKFVNLEKYERFFDDLYQAFVPPPPRAAAAERTTDSKPKLAVVEVGSFVASFVPTIGDFSRLDKRFRLPEGTWAKLPQYAKYGFAVFQLKADAHSVHPMAFTFPTRDDAKLFFPTVHIHDGEVHAKADFDHALYLQPEDSSQMLPRGWQESPRPAGMFMRVDAAQGLLEKDLHVYRRELRGSLKNADVVV